MRIIAREFPVVEFPEKKRTMVAVIELPGTVFPDLTLG